MNTRVLFFLVWMPLAMVCLAGCVQGAITAFTPEQAAIRAVLDQAGGRALVDQSSVQVRQSLPLDNNTFVVVSFNQMEGVNKSRCLFVYQIVRGSIGAWQPRGGGGGCTMTMFGQPEQPDQPLDVGGGQNGSSGPGDPGYSHVAGMVNQKDITKVRVTWVDGSQQEVNVINSSYIAVRAGGLNFQRVEGLNADGEVVYNNAPQVAPGKE